MQNQSYNFLVKKITATRSKESLMMLISSFFILLAIVALTIFATSIIEFFANGDTNFRTFLATIIGIFTISAFGIFTVPQILRLLGIKGLPTVNEIALKIGNFYPNIKDKLGNAIQLVANSEKNIGSSKILIEAETEAVYNETKNINFDVIINKKRNFRFLIFFLISTILTISTFAISSGINDAFFRIMNYSKSFLPPAPFEIQLLTKNQTLLRGTKTEIVFSAKGEAPDYILLQIKEENQQNYDEFRLKKAGENLYKYEIATVKQNMSFYGEANWLTSSILTEIGQIKVIDRPIIRSFSGKLNFPNYTKLASQTIDEQSADIAALAGSTAQFTINSNKNLKNAYIVFEKSAKIIDEIDGNNEKVNGNNEKNLNNLEKKSSTVDTVHIPLKVDNSKAFGSFRISQNGFYHFVIEDFDGEKNINPIKYSVVALSDGIPTISLLFPTSDVQVTEQAILPLKVAISDDYGFSNLKLYYRLAASKFSEPETNFHSATVPINSSELVAEVPYVWDLNKINIVPEDIYEFYLEISDNNSVPQKAKTQILKVRLPSMAEVSQEADISQNQITKDLENVKKETEQIKKNIEETERELLKKSKDKELDWKQKKQIQDILQKQNQLQEKMKELGDKVQETAEHLQQNNMLSPETMQKYQELQKLMKETRSPQLDNLRKMREQNLQKMSPEELRKAMEQAKFDEEKFKQSIERTIDILKRMQAEQKTDALTKRAESLKQNQDEINKELNKTNQNDKEKLNELAKKQEQLKNELGDISKDLKNLEQLMKEIGADEMPMQEMKEASEALDNQEIPQDMENSANEMQNSEKNKADKSQKSASSKLEKFAQKMQNVKKEMQDKNSKEIIRRLQKSIDNMAKISKQQETVKNQTQKSDANSTRIPDISEEQADIFENLYNLTNDLNEIGSKSFAVTREMAEYINEAMRNIRSTVDQLTERRMSQAVKSQTNAMKNMNAAMSQMKDALSQCQNGSNCENGSGQGGGQSSGQGQGMGASGSAGMQQMLQQMAAEQQALNQQMQQMMGQGGQGGENGQYSQEQRAGMKRLAGNQDRMRKSLEDLAKEQKELGGKPEDKNENQKLSNELTKLAEEMKEITTDINRGNISPETLQRQERILSRMLDATKSVNDRDFEKKRESKSGIDDIMRRSPAGIDLSTQEGKTRAMQELMQSIKKGYTKDYEQIIRQYFEAIQKNY